ncbi:TRAP transporter substrate-binding protein [Hungatella sp.]|uniref:TRAP transporter substrate-binding protein n=1 Tax=Hungatella sp. TaxID=2613924 RepID=UPI003999DD56
MSSPSAEYRGRTGKSSVADICKQVAGGSEIPERHEHVNNFLGFIINKNFYDGLSQEQQQIVTEAAAEFVKQQRQMELQDTQVYIDKLKESGMQVNTLTPEEKTAFKEALAPMYEKYKAEFGEEIFSMAEEYGQ